eukprot:Nk52_evm29s211 gene=Nk52_evmTU29s211
MGLYEICSLVCCPPLPSRIAAKLAFLPPDPPSYRFLEDHTNRTVLAHVPVGGGRGEGGVSVNGGGGEAQRDKGQPESGDSREQLSLARDCECVVFHPPRSIVLETARLRTRRGNVIAGYFLYRRGSRVQETVTLLYSHGNAADIGQMVQSLCYLCNAVEANVFVYDYSGYGVSTGRPLEANCYADVEAAWECLREQYGIPARYIIPYGQSIGSGPTMYLASRKNHKPSTATAPPSSFSDKATAPSADKVVDRQPTGVSPDNDISSTEPDIQPKEGGGRRSLGEDGAKQPPQTCRSSSGTSRMVKEDNAIRAIILHSPLMSGLRVLFPNEDPSSHCFDIFPNIDRIQKLSNDVQVMLIHGTQDDIVDFSHSLQLYEQCPNPVQPVWVEGAGHNDIELFPEYLIALRQFVEMVRVRNSRS